MEDKVELQGNLVEEFIVNEAPKLSMWIPSDLAGKVIGKKGIVILNLQRETKVDLINVLQAVGNSLWVPVVIIGKILPIIAAYNEISRMVLDEVDDVVLEFVVNYKKPFFIPPHRRLNVIKKISADTNVRIYFPDSPNHHGPKDSQQNQYNFAEPITLEGTCHNVQRAYQLLEKEVLLYKETPHPNSSSSHPKQKGTRAEKDPAQRHVHRVRSPPQDPPETSPGQHPVPPETATELPVPSLPPPPPEPAPAAAAVDPSPMTTAEPAPANPNSSSEQGREKVEKAVEVPSTLVGLLLSRGPQPNAVTVINQVQRLTSTFISKILSPKYTGKKISSKKKPSPGPPALPKSAPTSRRRETSSNDGQEEEEGEREEGLEEGPEEEEEVYPVTFRIFSFAEPNVDAAVSILQRMIAGERIREVLEQARSLTRGLQQFTDRISELYPSSATRERPPRPQGSEERPPKTQGSEEGPAGGRQKPINLHRRPAFRKDTGPEGEGKEDRGARRPRGDRGRAGASADDKPEKRDKPHRDRDRDGRDSKGRGRDRDGKDSKEASGWGSLEASSSSSWQV